MTRLNTFIVEDSPLLRDNLISALEELAPVRVVGTAEDESGAVAWMGANGVSCDLLIIDIFLKGGSGLGVLRALAAIPGRHPMSSVVLSNYATTEMRRKCLELGADKVFDKSSEIEELVEHVTALARRTCKT